MKGYMTVEASLVLPMVFGMVMFVMSMLFYSYDRCVLEQEVTSFLVGSGYVDGDVQEKACSLEQEIRNWYLDKYVWMDVAVRELVTKNGSVSLSIEGEYGGPFFSDVVVERHLIEMSPTFLIRQKNKWEEQFGEGEKEDENRVY